VSPVSLRKSLVVIAALAVLAVGGSCIASASQVWINCHITCRCLHDDSVGNFKFVIPVDVTVDTGYEANEACRVYGNRVCADGCNGAKFTFTFQVTGP
jgi:hypothetical protein